MAGIGLPWIDTWAPAQWTTSSAQNAPNVGDLQFTANTPGSGGSTGGGGGVSSLVSPQNLNISATIGGMVLLALITIFILHQLGFRFVVSASVGRG